MGSPLFEAYEKKHPGDWNKPEYRKFIRSQFRNNPKMVKEGTCMAYGALTGEENAIQFIFSGQEALGPDDTVVCYSDGFAGMVEESHFMDALRSGRAAFDELDHQLVAWDPGKYGRERTMIVLKKDESTTTSFR